MENENKNMLPNVTGAGQESDSEVDVRPSGLRGFFRRLTESEYFYLIGAFLLPIFIMTGVYACAEFFPFGNQSILSLDFQAQYIYYFEQIRRLLTEGGSWFYTWSRSLGGEFIGYVTYYMASPYNLIVALFPKAQIVLAVQVISLLKMGSMGVTFSLYIHKTRRPSELKTIVYSAMYALCAYTVIQQYNPMWIDAVIWLPLLVLGIERLVRERKVILYIVMLALILYCNYYIGYMCCIFTLFYFICYYWSVRNEIVGYYEEQSGFGGFFKCCGFRTFLRMAGATVVAVCIVAFTVIGAYYSLGFGKSGFSSSDFTFKFRFDFLDLFIRMLPGSYDTVRTNGLPFVYCGVLAVLGLPIFYMSPRVSANRKIMYSTMLAFVAVSFLINPIDLIWHGFSTPNWLNYRYSFMFSFLIVVMACDAIESVRDIKFGYIAASSVAVAVLVAVVQKLDITFTQSSRTISLDDMRCIGMTIALIAIYTAIMYLLRDVNAEQTASFVLAVIVAIELFAGALMNIDSFESDVGTVRYDNYVDGNSEKYDSYNGSVLRLTEIIGKIKENDNSLYRTESTVYRTRGGVNESMATGFYGIASSTSTLNKYVIRFLNKMGYASTSHWSKYLGGTPIGDSLLGIKYVVTTDKTVEANGARITQNNKKSFDANFYFKTIEVDEPYQQLPSDYKIYAMQNTKALPFAYGVSRSLLDYNPDFYSMTELKTAHDYQNELISIMLSEASDTTITVFEPINQRVSYSDCTMTKGNITYNWDGTKCTSMYYVFHKTGESAKAIFTITAPADGLIYFHFPSVNFGSRADIYVNDSFLTSYFEEEATCAMELGTFTKGEKITVEVRFSTDTLYIDADSPSFFWYIDYSQMNEAFDLLDASSLSVEKYGNAYIYGSADIAAGQELMFTTIPYDRGWNVYVDGKKVETQCAISTFLSFEVGEGYHEIEMKYFPTEYKIGIAISALGVVMLAVIVLYSYCTPFRSKVSQYLIRPKKAASDDAQSDVTDSPEAQTEEPRQTEGSDGI